MLEDERPTSTRSLASSSRTRSSTATSRSSGAPRRPRSGTGNFRIVYFGVFASNIGTWMQNVVLGAYALKLTGSSVFVGLVFFAQLGPLLFLSTLGGLLADVVDRRRFLVGAQLAQLGFSFALAGVALSNHPSHALIVASVFAVGIANALGAPGLNAILPTLVPREDLPGAVALASVQMNLSRVIGPIIGAAIYYALERGAGVRDQRADLRVRGDRLAVGEVPPAHERAGRGAGVRPARSRACASPAATR